MLRAAEKIQEIGTLSPVWIARVDGSNRLNAAHFNLANAQENYAIRLRERSSCAGAHDHKWEVVMEIDQQK